MKKENLELNRIGLFKIVSNLDTQSAIAAALVISVATFLFTGFINLCNYIYWRVYFTEFKIPLEYFDEAIIRDSGIKYTIILTVPLLILFWIMLSCLKKSVSGKIQLKCIKIKNKYVKLILNIFILLVTGLVFIYGLVEFIKERNIPLIMAYAELFIFIFYNISKSYFGRKFEFTLKKYYLVRIIGIAAIIYIFLGHVYYIGSFQNYSRNSAQVIKLVNYDISYSKNADNKSYPQLVLLETADYYYVTDVKISGSEVEIVNDDTYRFINKVDCPVKSIYTDLKFTRGKKDDNDSMDSYGCFFIISLILIFIFIAFLSIPIKKQEFVNETISNEER